MLSEIQVKGRIVKSAEVRDVGRDQVARLRLAVTHSKKRDGDQYAPSFFIDLELWGGWVPFAESVSKGDTIYVKGNLKQSEWTDDDGVEQKRFFIRGSYAHKVDWVDCGESNSRRESNYRKKQATASRYDRNDNGGW